MLRLGHSLNYPSRRWSLLSRGDGTPAKPRAEADGEETPQFASARSHFLPAAAPGPPRTPGIGGAIWRDLRTTGGEGNSPRPPPRDAPADRRAQSTRGPAAQGGRQDSNPPMSSGRGGWAELVLRNEPPLSVGLQPRGCSRPVGLFCFCWGGRC